MLGIAEGDERDAALRHSAGCAGCRRLLSELTAIGDELLLLAPPRDPPSGFESRVLGAVSEPPKRRGFRWPTLSKRWVAVATTTAVFGGVVGAGSVFLATADDRRVAGDYEAVLSEAQGSFFTAAPLQGAEGRVGTVFGYQGQPSWIMVTLRSSAQPEGPYQVHVVTNDGRYVSLGETSVGGAGAAWGQRLPVDLSLVHEIRFQAPDGRTALTATFDAATPWE